MNISFNFDASREAESDCHQNCQYRRKDPHHLYLHLDVFIPHHRPNLITGFIMNILFELDLSLEKRNPLLNGLPTTPVQIFSDHQRYIPKVFIPNAYLQRSHFHATET